MAPSASRSARNVWNARQRGQLTKGAAGRRAGAAAHQPEEHLEQDLSSSGCLEEAGQQPDRRNRRRFVIRSLGSISAICQRARRRHRRSARLVCGTAQRRQAAHVSHSSRVFRRIRGAGCRARPRWVSEAKRRGRSRSRAAQRGSAAFLHEAFRVARRCGPAVGETSPSECQVGAALPSLSLPECGFRYLDRR